MSPIGQIIPALPSAHLTNVEFNQIKAICRENDFHGRLTIYIGSQNPHKMKSALDGITKWAKQFFQELAVSYVVSGAKSNVPEQPVGREGEEGALNRLAEVHHKYKSYLAEKEIHVFVSFENAITEEKIDVIQNKHMFETKEGYAWVDRCVVVGQIYLGKDRMWKFSSHSKGVTVPKEYVEESRKTQFHKTAGSFIAEHYQCPNDDWHEIFGGVSRKKLMTDALEAALGMPQG
jgi:non-canonical (house-cleaning) NTP pyrophosphatase